MIVSKKIKQFRLLAAIIAISLFTSRNTEIYVYAKEVSGQKNGLDVTFVVDVSGSMKTNDPNGIALEMVKAFIDTVHTNDLRIGFVAFSDEIVAVSELTSLSSPKGSETLKELISNTAYAGETDIGLGLASGYDLLSKANPANSKRNQAIILISDGETDLRASTTGRTEEQSEQDIARVTENCGHEGTPIYTIAFGDYEGGTAVLEQIAAETGAKTYTATTPDFLLEVLYEILGNNVAYRIQQFSEAEYAKGTQEIRCIVNDKYLDELNILLVSPSEIGESVIMYRGNLIPFMQMSNYAVAKIGGDGVDDTIQEFTVLTETADGQKIKIFVIGYRDLMPILNLNAQATRNELIPFGVYFQGGDGAPIENDAFYRQFTWQITIDGTELPSSIKDGYIQGELSFPHSGTYTLEGKLADDLGSYSLRAVISITNNPPSGELPVIETHVLEPAIILDLKEFFSDPDHDELVYSLQSSQGGLDVILNDSTLTIKAIKSGLQTFSLSISDGEEAIVYTHRINVVPLWKAYWWLLVIPLILLVFVAIFIIKRLCRQLPGPEQIEHIKSRSSFSGRLNFFFMMLPDQQEIPPFFYDLYKIKENKLRLSDLLSNYPEEAEKLGLHNIYMIAAEERDLILFHSSESSVMVGSAIVCRQLRFLVSYDDVIYITSPDGAYDLELHYIKINH